MDEFNQLVDSLGGQLKKFLDDISEGPSVKDQVLAFVHAVDWKEPWIIALVVFHVLLLATVLLTRRRETLQFAIFTAGVLAVWSAEQFNALGARHWKAFSKQDYFDQSGLFMSVLFSGPLMVICIIILIQLMITVVETMFKWKKAELKQRARAAARAAPDSTTPGRLKGE